MAILFPHWATPILEVFRVPWPDIDEDTVLDLGTRVADIADALETFTTSVHGALSVLSTHTESAAFAAFVEEWDSTSNAFIKPIKSAAQEAQPLARTAHDAIVAAKSAIIVVLTAQMATTFAGPIGAAVRLAAKKAIEAAIEEATKIAVGIVVNEVNGQIESQIINPMKDFVQKAIEAVSFGVKQVAVDLTPSLGTVSDETMTLIIDVNDVTVAVEKVKEAFIGIQEAVAHLAAWQAGSGYTSPAPDPDPLIRDMLTPVLDHMVTTVHNEINDLGNKIVKKLTNNLVGTWERLSTADGILDSEAVRLKRAMEIPAPMHIGQIERSTDPELIAIQRAAAAVVTGAGHSDARDDIRQIVIERAGAPVVTGPGQSDARDKIQEIVIERAAAAVLTGPGESAARENIQEIVIEKAPEPVTVGRGESTARENIQEIVIERAGPAVVTGSADSDARERIKPLATQG